MIVTRCERNVVERERERVLALVKNKKKIKKNFV